MRPAKPAPEPLPELTGKQFAGRMFLFFAGCLIAFRGVIYLGDQFLQ